MGSKVTSFAGLNENQLDALCRVYNYGQCGSYPSTVRSLLSRGLIERTGRATYRCTESGSELVRRFRAEYFGE